MVYVKKMVMQGFKSFARRTEIPFENSMNVIVGPNGSGKSNIADAICFVLGRLSIKSIRAAKAANLIFSGNSQYKAPSEAFVEIVFDNSDGSFPIDKREVSIKRVVRRTGNSVYKINGETKTRQDLIELLGSAGIDSNGFNIVLQGEIESLVKSSPEDKRKIIEEVAGISIYETRKAKSLRELEKTEERLKEASSVLRERKNYLKNLEKERLDAINYQKLDETIKRCKKSLLLASFREKKKEASRIEGEVESYLSEIDSIRKKINSRSIEMEELSRKIDSINEKINLHTKDEQEALHREIGELKAELAGLKVRKENFESRISYCSEKIGDAESKIEELEIEISRTKTISPSIKEKQKERKKLQETFEKLEKERKEFYTLKSELMVLEEKRAEKKRAIEGIKKEIENLERNFSLIKGEIKHSMDAEDAARRRIKAKERLGEIILDAGMIEKKILEIERGNAAFEQEIKMEEGLKENIESLEVCPVCKQKVGDEHKKHINHISSGKIESLMNKVSKNKKKLFLLRDRLEKLLDEKAEIEKELKELELDELNSKALLSVKSQIERLKGSLEENLSELSALNNEISDFVSKLKKFDRIEEKYDEARVKLDEVSFLDEDIDSSISVKNREINRHKLEIKARERELEESKRELEKIVKAILHKEKELAKKEEKERELYERFQRLFSDRASLEDRMKALETDKIGFEHSIRGLEEKITNLKILKAQNNAQAESLIEELKEYESFEEIKASIEQIKERLQKAQFRISRLGNVNLKALDVFEKVEDQCRKISEKVEGILKEKEKIERIIREIDRKKKKTFLKTLDSINYFFNRNFSQLSRKGEAFLELENKKNPFEGGLNILIRVSKGKYFDINSLSGGEKTLVALSLIFAIQEHSPYPFYIFDEIDAALDKHNSELLAALIKKYMKEGQYIVITHNDTLISGAVNLYGVSMQDGISKIVSLKI